MITRGTLLSPSPIPLSNPPLLSPSPIPLSYPPLLSPSPIPLFYPPLLSPSPIPLSNPPLLFPSPIPLSYPPLLSPSPIPLSYPPLLSPSPIPLFYPPLLSPSPIPLSNSPLLSPSPIPLSYPPLLSPSPIPLSYPPQGQFPIRKISIGSDWTFFHLVLYIHTVGPKKVENTSTLYHPSCGSQIQTGTENWYRKPMRGFNFAPVPSHAYFPQYKSALTRNTYRITVRSWCTTISSFSWLALVEENRKSHYQKRMCKRNK